MRLYLDRTGVLNKRRRHQSLPASSAHQRGKAVQGRTRCPGGEISLETNPASWSWTSSLQMLREVNVCCFSHPVGSVLLWQPEQTNTHCAVNSHVWADPGFSEFWSSSSIISHCPPWRQPQSRGSQGQEGQRALGKGSTRRCTDRTEASGRAEVSWETRAARDGREGVERGHW